MQPVQQAPFSQEAEEGVLGSLMIDPDAVAIIAAILKPEHFFILRNNYIYAAILGIAQKKHPVDFITVQEELRTQGHLNDVGGAAYLLQLVNNTPTSRNVEAYAQLVLFAALRRQLMATADEMKALALQENIGFESVLVEAEKRFMNVRRTAISREEETFKETLSRIFGEIEQRMQSGQGAPGILSGFRAYDEMTYGAKNGELLIWAGRPGMGKTSMLLSLMLNAARQGKSVGLASQEMSRDQVVMRMVAMESGVNLQALSAGRLNGKEWSAFVLAIGNLSKLPIHVTDANRLTIPKLQAKAMRWQQQEGLDLLFVDYLQILSSGGAYRPSERTQEVGYFARELKQVARDLKIPVHVAAQLSRAVETRQDKRPTLSDLRESGEIENEADVITFLYRDSYYNDASEMPSCADLIIAKQRNGPTGTVSLHFEKSSTKFSNMRVETIDLRNL